MQNKTLCFTGHRELPTGEDLVKLKGKLLAEIKNSYFEGYNHFIFGGAQGFDLLAAKTVLELANEYGDIKLTAAIPFKGQSSKFSFENKILYDEVLCACNNTLVLSQTYSKDCYKIRNQYMVDKSSKVIAYYNGKVRNGTGQTVRMAMTARLNIVNLFF